MSHTDFAVELSGVTKIINQTKIVNDLSLRIRKGIVTALLGPNGAGKTSTIRIIMGLLRPQFGYVQVFGIDTMEDPELIRQKVGLLPQIDAGYKSLTAKENLEFLVRLSGNSLDEVSEDLQKLLERLELGSVMDQKFGTLSGGERRALGFVRAILTGSQLLILDEPTTGLDLARAASMRRIIQEQAAAGKTVLMSSHVITDLEELAEDIIIMRDGHVVKSGSREDIQEYFAPGGQLEQAIVAAFTNSHTLKETTL